MALAGCFAAAVVVAILALIRALSLILFLVPNSIKLATVVGVCRDTLYYTILDVMCAVNYCVIL